MLARWFFWSQLDLLMHRWWVHGLAAGWLCWYWLYSYMFWRRKWQPTLVFLPGESHGQRKLAGSSSWGCRESDTTEQLTLSLYIYLRCSQMEQPGSPLLIFQHATYTCSYSHVRAERDREKCGGWGWGWEGVGRKLEREKRQGIFSTLNSELAHRAFYVQKRRYKIILQMVWI